MRFKERRYQKKEKYYQNKCKEICEKGNNSSNMRLDEHKYYTEKIKYLTNYSEKLTPTQVYCRELMAYSC